MKTAIVLSSFSVGTLLMVFVALGCATESNGEALSVPDGT